MKNTRWLILALVLAVSAKIGNTVEIKDRPEVSLLSTNEAKLQKAFEKVYGYREWVGNMKVRGMTNVHPAAPLDQFLPKISYYVLNLRTNGNWSEVLASTNVTIWVNKANRKLATNVLNVTYESDEQLLREFDRRWRAWYEAEKATESNRLVTVISLYTNSAVNAKVAPP
jgi:hypothetical protein